mgnify:FL=1
MFDEENTVENSHAVLLKLIFKIEKQNQPTQIPLFNERMNHRNLTYIILRNKCDLR